MFKRLRQLRISLAAKCQILFGAAVLLIIGAALFVPWRRMEQLTEDLNQRTAGALADNALLEHVRLQEAGVRHDQIVAPTSQPTSRPVNDLASLSATKPSHDQRPASMPSAGQSDAEQEQGLKVPRLFGINSIASHSLDLFEYKAISHFRHRPKDPSFHAYYTYKAGYYGYKYAQPVFLTRQCSACHGKVDDQSTRPAMIMAPGLEGHARAFVPLSPDQGSALVGLISVDIPSRIQERQLVLNRLFILLAFLLAGTLAILSFYLITTRLILQPVRVLQETAEKVSQGDLNIRSDISTGDEFQQLSETLNTMLSNLKTSADQLRAVNKGLDLKLGQLAESNLALYESNRLKSEFLANVSHELRTPLNSILGFADLLKDAVGGAPESRPSRYVSNILQSGRALLDLINDLLDLAKIEAGKMEIRSEPLSLTDLFEGLGNILKPLTEARELTVDHSTAPDVPIIWTDPGKLQQILYNFLSNAIKFSPAGSTITLSAARVVQPPPAHANGPIEEADERILISVADHGPGIAADKQQLIFEKFRQVDASHTRVHGGTGLGLAISKELTHLLGGTIGVRSSPGEGSVFWISIPLRIEAGARDLRQQPILSG